MDRTNRMELLKLAAPRSQKKRILSGAKNIRELHKFLDYAKYTWSKESEELKNTVAEIAKLENRRDELSEQTKKMRKDISEVYDIIQVMGLHGAKEVRISDDGEIAYVKGGKLFCYDKASDTMIPRNKYKKEQLNSTDEAECGETMYANDNSYDNDEDLTDISFGDDVEPNAPTQAKQIYDNLDPSDEGVELNMGS